MTGFLRASDLRSILLGEALLKDLKNLSSAERRRVMPFIERGDSAGLVRELETILAETETKLGVKR